MAVRWRNHKSHIKKSIRSCELANHFVSLSSSTHKLDKSTQANFTSDLKEHLSIILIESVIPETGVDVETTLKMREDFWQGALKSTPLFGGINKRSNRTKSNGQNSDERKIYALEQNRILLNQSVKDTYSRIVNPPI
ncbi:hypothetical protein ACHWQZ_G009028 [Mnemiopsis leidyi]